VAAQKKSGLRDVKRANFIWNWRRSELKKSRYTEDLRKTLEIIHITSFIWFWQRSGL